jgi:hypothetical protein
MTLDEFRRSLKQNAPPAGLTLYLQALWHEGKGGWDQAHEIVQDIETPEASWIHAYLHRKEGDVSNARYWYGRARKSFPSGTSLEDEWESLVEDMM